MAECLLTSSPSCDGDGDDGDGVCACFCEALAIGISRVPTMVGRVSRRFELPRLLDPRFHDSSIHYPFFSSQQYFAASVQYQFLSFPSAHPHPQDLSANSIHLNLRAPLFRFHPLNMRIPFVPLQVPLRPQRGRNLRPGW